MPSQVAKAGRRPNKDAPSISPRLQQRADRIVRLLRARKAGHTLEAIAESEGISHQAVSKLLAKYGPSTAIEARQIYEARSAAMALHTIEHGRPADHVLVHKALNVLPQDSSPQTGLSITINGFALVGLGLGGESPAIPQQIAVESDNRSYVNEANSLITEDITAQTRTDSEAEPNRALDSPGDPTPVGMG